MRRISGTVAVEKAYKQEQLTPYWYNYAFVMT